jgi:cell division protein ZapE
MPIKLDQKQIEAQNELEKIAINLQNQRNISWFKNFFIDQKRVKSFYLHGDVGRGKSMLMKKFYSTLPKEIEKCYFHFNNFIKTIHESLKNIRKEKVVYKDELIEAINRIIQNAKLICLDEFQVIDIADAMLLSRIFIHLFKKNLTIVFTSNSHPLELYKNGLQREFFIDFVNKTLLPNCEVFFLNNQIDYRDEFKKNLVKRYFISNKKNREIFEEAILCFTKNQKLKSKKITVWGREIKIKKTFENIAIVSFDEICRVELGASDYQMICKNFDLIFLRKLPKLNEDNLNELRRFILFIDEVYENRVSLIILAKTKISEIYDDSKIKVEALKRTISRLKEIKSDEYWKNSKAMNLGDIITK